MYPRTSQNIQIQTYRAVWDRVMHVDGACAESLLNTPKQLNRACQNDPLSQWVYTQRYF